MKKSKEIAQFIWEDLSDRKGFRQVIDSIDEIIIAAILHEWTKEIENILKKEAK